MMNTITDWITTNLTGVGIPLAVFAATLIATFWLRSLATKRAAAWSRKTKWPVDEMIVKPARSLAALWCLLVSAYLALSISRLQPLWKDLAGKGIGILLLASITLALLNLVKRLILEYGPKIQVPQRVLVTTWNIVRAVILLFAATILLDILGAPMTPVILLIVLAAIAAVVALRDIGPDIIAGVQLSATRHVIIGDYVKLQTGEEGEIIEMHARHTRLRSLDQSISIIPNSRLMQVTMVNYGQPLKKAAAPFQFYSRADLTELTGLEAKNLGQLADVLKQAPESVVSYHTHHFLLEHQYLTPEPANDFGVWISDVLDDEALGERIAAVDTFEFSSLAVLRERLVGIMDECLSRGNVGRDAPEGREFRFLKSVSAVFPTPYVVHDLREFVEALKKVSVGSIYFHIFESRMRLGRGLNDFSVWLDQNLGEKELSESIARLDPYSYTLEGLRSSLVQLIEKRVK